MTWKPEDVYLHQRNALFDLSPVDRACANLKGAKVLQAHSRQARATTEQVAAAQWTAARQGTEQDVEAGMLTWHLMRTSRHSSSGLWAAAVRVSLSGAEANTWRWGPGDVRGLWLGLGLRNTWGWREGIGRTGPPRGKSAAELAIRWRWGCEGR